MLRQALTAAARSGRVKGLVTTAPLTRGLVERFVAGETVDDALRVTQELHDQGLLVTLDHLGEDTLDAAQADAVTQASVEAVERLFDAGLAKTAEVSVKPTALGLKLGNGGAKIARDNIARVASAAKAAGTTVSVDMEDHTTTAETLRLIRELRVEFPDLGAVVQGYLRRTVSDCADLTAPGSRVRLVKGAYDEPDAVAFTSPGEVDRSFVRCMRTLMAGEGYPMIATHDPRLIEIAGALALLNERPNDSFEYQMLYGIRPDEQRRLADAGARVRVYVPYGDDWYGYLMRRLAERPANLGFFLRSLVTKS
ncbi:MAG TPA: proline dehydrogenase family protein [Streptosporangiaceae bacterium]